MKPLALVGRHHPALRRVCDPVDPGSPAVKRLVVGLRMLLKRYPGGYAIAAPQAGHSVQVVVFANGGAWANPTVSGRGVKIQAVEGCLSLPKRRFIVDRHAEALVTAIDLRTGDSVSFVEHDALTARAWQHEADHLAGRLISDRWPELRRAV